MGVGKEKHWEKEEMRLEEKRWEGVEGKKGRWGGKGYDEGWGGLYTVKGPPPPAAPPSSPPPLLLKGFSEPSTDALTRKNISNPPPPSSFFFFFLSVRF